MSVSLFHGDCREILPSLPPVDTVITDPVWPNTEPGLIPGWEDPVGLLAEALAHIECKRLVIILRHDSDPRFLSAVPTRWPFFRIQILPYVMPQYIGRKLGGDEIAYCFGEPIPSAPGRRVIPGYAPRAQPDDRKPNGHPCSRSLKHIRWLVSWWSMPGETVLDPFMGSGQTGVGCVELGERNFYGIELEKTYFDIAERNVALALESPTMQFVYRQIPMEV